MKMEPAKKLAIKTGVLYSLYKPVHIYTKEANPATYAHNAKQECQKYPCYSIQASYVQTQVASYRLTLPPGHSKPRSSPWANRQIPC